MGYFVIVAYRPHKGKEQQLLEVVRDHLPVLRSQGLATERPPLVLRAADDTIIEIFEWKSKAAVDQAHTNKAVQELWGRFAQVCDYQSLASLEECKQLFAHFEPVDL